MRTRETAWEENYKNRRTSTIKVSQGSDPDFISRYPGEVYTKAKISGPERDIVSGQEEWRKKKKEGNIGNKVTK